MSDSPHSISMQPGGGAKKFLYTGPKSKETAEEDQWSFAPHKTSSSGGSVVDLDDVWSIKRNVGIGAAQQNKLNLNANKTFYSRHGGMKDKGATPALGGNDDGTRAPARRGYSYSSGATSDPIGSGARQTNKWSQDEYDF